MTPESAQSALGEAIALHEGYMRAPSAAGVRDLHRAIQLYELVLRIYTEEAFPVQWATTLNNLAIAYQNLPTGERGANLQRAIDCYLAALRVRTPEQLPFDCLQTLRNLGDLYFSAGRWDEALEACAQAVAVTEQIRLAALREAERRRILRESWMVFERAVLCAMRTEQFALALTLTERGKTRGLADHLARREVKPHGVSEAEWQEYQKHLSAAAELERSLSGSSAAEGDARLPRERGAAIHPHGALGGLRSVRQSIAALEVRFREADPDYLAYAPPLEMGDIAGLAAAAGAVIVEFRVTREGTYVFLVGPDEKEVTAGQVVEIPEFTDDALWQMLVGPEHDTPADGWLAKYDRFRRRPASLLPDWLACVARCTRALYERLLRPVHRRLQERYPEARRLIVVPNKGLNLLPLHACWWEDEAGQRRHFLDEYDIAYTPSCQVLRRCLARERANGAPATRLFAVQNPDGSLSFSDWEVEEICKFFPEGNRVVLAGPQATKARVKERIAFGQEQLFSCHGLFDLADVERSCLELCEGRLAVPEIVPLDLRGTWLVVKSACETGLTDIRDIIDEYQGLPAAFLMAGAATAVPSLWAVNDFSTALLMQRFHANLYERGMAKATALREAQRWLRDLGVAEVEALLGAKRRAMAAAGLSHQRMSALDAVAARFHLRELAASYGGRPFANPHWWAAFQCVGAGWNPAA